MPSQTVWILLSLHKFIHITMKSPQIEFIKKITTFLDSCLVLPFAEWILNTVSLIVNPTTIQPGNKPKVGLFIQNLKPFLCFLSDIVTLLHIITGAQSMKLNKLLVYAIANTLQLSSAIYEGKKCSCLALSIMLSLANSIFSAYSTAITAKTSSTMFVHEAVFECLCKLFTSMSSVNYTGLDFDTSYDSLFKTYASPSIILKMLGNSQWEIINSLLVIAGIDPNIEAEVHKKAKALTTFIRKVVLPVTIGNTLHYLYDTLKRCYTSMYSNLETIPEEDVQDYIETIQECWSAYQQDLDNAHRGVVTSLIELILHPVMMSFESIRCSDAYQTLLSDILVAADKCWLLGRSLIGQIIPLTINHPNLLTGTEDFLSKLALSQVLIIIFIYIIGASCRR